MEIGTVIGGAGLLSTIGFGLYQYRKRKQETQQKEAMKQRLDRKEELENLSDELQSLHDRITTLCDQLLQPRLHEDMEFALYNLGTDVLSYAHAANDVPLLRVEEVRIFHSGNRRDVILEEAEDVLSFYKNESGGELVSVSVGIQGGEDVLPYPIDTNLSGVLRGINYVYIKLYEIQEEYDGLLHNFDASMLEDTEDTIDQLTLACYEQIFEGKDGMKIDIEDYKNPLEIEDAIYEEFLLSEETYSMVEELREIADRVDEVQTDVIKTGFS